MNRIVHFLMAFMAMVGFSASAETVYNMGTTPAAGFIGSVAQTVQARLGSTTPVCESLIITSAKPVNVPVQQVACTLSGDGALLYGYAADDQGVGAFLLYVTPGAILAMPAGDAFADIPGADSDAMAVRRIRIRLEETDAPHLSRHVISMLGDSSLLNAYLAGGGK